MLLGVGAAALEVGATPAQAPIPSRAGQESLATARANSGTVGVISGGVEGTYIRIAADLASVLDDGERLRVLPVIGKGSVQNIADIIYLRGIDIGIVQSDSLAYVLREKPFPVSTNAIKYITKLYDEEIHVLARREITQVADLNGKKVNIDVLGSGTAMTASLVFDRLGVNIQPRNEPQSNALKQLQEGEIAALVYVAGKPANLFRSPTSDSGLHFLPLPATSALMETYLPAQLDHGVYPALIGQDEPVDTLAVGAVMAVFGWQPGSERHRKVATFVASLSEKFARLQQPPRHPKWRDVNLGAELPGWSRFTAAAGPTTSPGLRFRSNRDG
jgi:TRAP transporter TAXI family solute receptor